MSPWPLKDWTAWSRAFGDATFRVPDGMMATVAALFAVATYLVAASAGLVRMLGSAWIYRAGTWVIAAVFVLRALIGEYEMAHSLANPAMPAGFRATTLLYMRIHLPLFFILGVLVGYVALASSCSIRRGARTEDP